MIGGERGEVEQTLVLWSFSPSCFSISAGGDAISSKAISSKGHLSQIRGLKG